MAMFQANYRQQYFQHSEVTPIRGKPTYESIYALHAQIKSNAASVPSVLGGGQHGYLGLCLSPVRYNQLSLVPFILPADPGAYPTARVGMSWEEMQARRLVYNDERNEFQKAHAIQAALKQQINEAIEPDFLKDLQHPISKTIEHPIHIIFETLFRKYGKINNKILRERRTELEQYNYNASLPPDTIFNMIDEYEELTIHAESPITLPQKIDIGYTIFQETGKFSRALRKWTQKDGPDKTWANFKIHFQEASDEHMEFGATTAAEAHFSAQQANSIAEQVAAQLQPVLQAEQTTQVRFSEDQVPQPATAPDQNNLLLHTINMLQEQMQAMQAAIAQPNTRRKQRGRNGRGNSRNNNNNNNNNNGNSNNGNQFGYGQNNYQQTFNGPPPGFPPHQMPNQYTGFVHPSNYNQQPLPRQQFQMPSQNNQLLYQNQQNFTGNPYLANQQFRNPQEYCWTHGLCAHAGCNCRTPAEGHQPNATRENRMGGSNKNL